MTYSDLQRWSEAGVCYDKSYQLAREIGDVRLQATIKLNRVKLYLVIRDWLIAEALCKQALRMFLHLEDNLGEAEVYKFLGIIYTMKQKWSEAISLFEQSIQITRKFKNLLTEAEIHHEYARMLKQKNDLKSAQKQYKTALELFTQLGIKNKVEEIEAEISGLM